MLKRLSSLILVTAFVCSFANFVFAGVVTDFRWGCQPGGNPSTITTVPKCFGNRINGSECQFRDEDGDWNTRGDCGDSSCTKAECAVVHEPAY